jgi:GTPase Era involved in 16S rRNA processing
MTEFGLGPNGALKKAYELTLTNKELRSKLHAVKGDFTLLDTAGSLEVFLFGGAALLEEFADAVCFVVEQDDVMGEREATVLKALNALQRLDYSLPTVTVVNKTDLNAKTRGAQMLLGGYKAADEHLTALLKELGSRERLVRVSAMDRRGFDELFDSLNELNCACGDSS